MHILNGDAVVETFINADLGGKYVVWRELYCQGPTILNIGSNESRALRAKFITEFLGTSTTLYINKWESQLDLLQNSELEEVTLWFEYDLFCQFNMMAAIHHIRTLNPDCNIFLINVGKALDQKEWIILNHLSSQDWKGLYQSKKHLNKIDIDWMSEAWLIYNTSDHQLFDQIIDFCPIVFKYFPQAIENHFRRFPSKKDHLTDIQRFVLSSIRNSPGISKNNLLGKLLHHFHYYGYGDQQYIAMIKALYFVQEHQDTYGLISGSTDQGMKLADLPDMVYGGMLNKSKYMEDFIEV